MPHAPSVLSRKKNLVLVHHPGWQDISDFLEIKSRVEKRAPDINVLIASNSRKDVDLERRASLNPTLVVCPSALGKFRPRRGRVHKGARIPKNKQLQRLAELSIPVPRWALADAGLRPDPDEWGPLLLIKPAHSFSGQGASISIVPTSHYRFRQAHEYPEDHAGRHAPMLVQSFIRTGKAARHYRVNTLYGRALYCLLNERTKPLPDLDNMESELFSDAIATNVREQSGRELRLVDDADVLALAAKCHRAFPEVPLKGVDIIREVPSGNLYVLELNCTSNTWHISSNYFRRNRVGPVTREKMVMQFGVWDVAADVLIHQTRLQAV